MSDLENLKATAGLALFPIVCTEREARALLAKLATPDSIIELFDKLEAAEAQVKELTADLDKESEIRHRIHEELNAIKGEQQPVGAFHISGGEVEATSDYIEPGGWPANDGIVEVYAHPAPALLPPEPKETDCPEWIADPFSWTCGAGWMRHQAIAMGAKPLPMIDIRHIGHISVKISGQRYTYLDKGDVLHALKETGIRIRTQDADTTEGLEVNS